MSKDLVGSLIQSQGFPRVSIYLPMHVKGNEIDENPIRLKNALQGVRHQLEGADMDAVTIDAMLSEASAKVDDHVYWRYQKPALGVFIEPEITRFAKLPGEINELAVISERYHIRPLIRIFRDSGHYHILAVTRQSTRFFDADRRSASEVAVEDMPESIEKVRGKTDFEDNLGYHMRSSVGPRGNSSVPSYNAQGESPEDYDEVLLEHYIRDIAKAVEHHRAQLPSPVPLVIVADARTLGRLKQHMSDGQTIETVNKDPASASDDELHGLCNEAVSSWLDGDRRDALARLDAFAQGDPDTAGGRAVEDIWRACNEGRVATLFVARDEVVWGRIDEATGVVAIEDEAGPENEDLLNLLSLRALAQGADVFAMTGDVRSKLGPVAALYRY